MEEDQVSPEIITYFSIYHRRTHQTVVVFVQGLQMDDARLQPTDFGWEDIESKLFAYKMLNLLPDDLFKPCKCKTICQKKVWSCFKAEGQLKSSD